MMSIAGCLKTNPDQMTRRLKRGTRIIIIAWSVTTAATCDMGSRFYHDRLVKAGIQHRRSMSSMWIKPHAGRYIKRRLSKARRRAARRLCRYGDDNLQRVERGLRRANTECNWKGL